jgi:predicted small secreted protein
MKRYITLIAAVAMFALAGCNTLNGVGQDLQKAGDAISGASKK